MPANTTPDELAKYLEQPGDKVSIPKAYVQSVIQAWTVDAERVKADRHGELNYLRAMHAFAGTGEAQIARDFVERVVRLWQRDFDGVYGGPDLN